MPPLAGGRKDKAMKYVKKSLLSGVVATLLALLLLTRGAQAATTGTCAWKFAYSPNGTGGSSLSGVAAVSGHDVWAVGQQGGNTLTEHWNGAQWSIVHSPNVGSTGSFLQAVTAISTNDVWAVG